MRRASDGRVEVESVAARWCLVAPGSERGTGAGQHRIRQRSGRQRRSRRVGGRPGIGRRAVAGDQRCSEQRDERDQAAADEQPLARVHARTELAHQRRGRDPGPADSPFRVTADGRVEEHAGPLRRQRLVHATTTTSGNWSTICSTSVSGWAVTAAVSIRNTPQRPASIKSTDSSAERMRRTGLRSPTASRMASNSSRSSVRATTSTISACTGVALVPTRLSGTGRCLACASTPELRTKPGVRSTPDAKKPESIQSSGTRRAVARSSPTRQVLAPRA